MRRSLTAVVLLLLAAGSGQARGLLIPVEKQLPPLALLDHKVTVAIDDQVAVTRVEQTFRNHTDRQLEATYIFPVPKEASVRKFSMWVNGKELPGDLVEADKARKIYTDIVQRTLDPGLLEYMDHNLLKLRVFPIPPRGDQKIALSYTSVAQAEGGLVTYMYPLRTDAKAVSTLEKFALTVDLKSQHPLQNIYSPSHGITVTRPNDRQAIIGFEKDQAVLDKDFVLYYTAGGKDVGLTTIAHRPTAGTDGYVMLLVSPRAELSKEQQVPRDMVFVLDTSGSMRGKRMDQARKALKYCLTNLTSKDRFGLMNFATTVNQYTETLLPAAHEQIEQARKWVDALEATGGTAINDALAAALALRPSDAGRTFTIVFFTDGRPTIGETDSEKILKNVAARNTANTRIFTFGVGDDVNATMLDTLAEESRGVSTFVRESEDIEAKVSGLYAKISNPVLTDLKLAVGPDVKLSEIYPPQLPDLFHGTQLVVLARYHGHGHAAVKLTGNVGKELKEFVYEVSFADKAALDKSFVEDLWARRKVGYLLDQIRRNGQKKELVDEVVTLAKRYGITTPYTSYLVVPDAPVPVFNGAPRPGKGPVLTDGGVPLGLAPAREGAGQKGVEVFARQMQKEKGELQDNRGRFQDKALKELEELKDGDGKKGKAAGELASQKRAFDQAREMLLRRKLDEVQGGQLGVDLSVQTNNLRNQTRLNQNAVQRVQSRNVLEVGGVWIDEGFEAKTPSVAVKAMSPAYFRILERHPAVRDVFRLGNHVVWIAPSGTALIIDTQDGNQQMSDADIDRLFTVKKQ